MIEPGSVLAFVILGLFGALFVLALVLSFTKRSREAMRSIGRYISNISGW
jgi:Sec-independent protein translocase protein TatA